MKELFEAVRGFAALSVSHSVKFEQELARQSGLQAEDILGEALVLEINRDVKDGMALSAIVRGLGDIRVGDPFVCGALSGYVTWTAHN